MGGRAGKKWIIKNAEGILRGPYSTEEVLARINRGDYSGDEMISEYPGASWYPISQDPHFYDRLLEVLSQQSFGGEDEPPPAQPAQQGPVETTPTPSPDLSTTLKLEEAASQIHPPASSTSKSEPENPYGPDDDELDVQTEIAEEFTEAPVRNRVHRETPDSKKRSSRQDDDIELVDIKKRVKKQVVKGAWKPAMFASLVLAAGFYLLLDSSNTQTDDERIHLLAPQMGKTVISTDQMKTKIQKGVTEYLRDGFAGYLRAQNELVQAVEGGPANPEVLALLCMTYYELWPYAHQDSRDVRVISLVNQEASKVDGAGVHAATCKVVDLLLKGRYGEARSLSNSIIEANSGGQPPIPFYYFMAILAEASNDIRGAIGFLTTAQGLWPQWHRVFIYQAQLYARLENYAEAARIYRSILKASPTHDVAKIELGLLEYKQFRNLDKGVELIRAGLQSGDRLQRRTLSRGYLGLAEIYLQRHANSEALKFAKQSYQLDSTNSVAKNLVIQLGGSSEVGRTQFKAYQLIAEGDQFFREGDCNTAQAHYKTAFEIDKKSAQAAMKAGECLWQLSLSTEAIEWLNKAIRADPNMIEAYVTLADYYSRRYNFVAAAQVLLSAQKVAPRSYEVFRGFAMVELRRNNLKSAVENAKHALAIYDTDVEAHVIMSEALIELGQFQEAFAHASRARELDPNHRRAQTAYGRSLGGVKGSETAADYFNELVKTYPLVNEYRLALGKQLLIDERFSEAERVFTELTRVDDKSKEAFLQLGKVLRMQSKFPQSLQAYDRAAILDPSDAEPLFQAASLYLDAGKPVEAQVQLQRVLRINKLYPLVHYNLGRANLMLGDAAAALKEAKEERGINPNLAESYLLAAEAYSAQQQYTLCVGEYQNAIKRRPQSAMIYLRMAVCYRKADQLDVAIKMLNQAAVQESGLPDIYRELGSIYEIKGEMLEAVKAYQQYFVLNPNAADRSAIEARLRAYRH